MISDPDDPEFRYPQPGERYWHVHWNEPCLIDVAGGYSIPEDEVYVLLGDRLQRAIVKLKSLEPMP